HSATLQHAGQIQGQEVGDHELHVRRELWGEPGSDVAIDFDCSQVRDSGSEPERQRAGAGAYLQEAIVILRFDRGYEPVGPRRLEEMLAKSSSRANHGRSALHCQHCQDCQHSKCIARFAAPGAMTPAFTSSILAIPMLAI